MEGEMMLKSAVLLRKVGETPVQHDSYKEQRDYQTKAFRHKGRHDFKAANFPLGKQKLFTTGLLHFSAPCLLSCPTVKQLKLSLTSYSSFISLKTSRIFLSYSVTYSSNRQISPPTVTSSRLSSSMFIFFLVVFLQIFFFFCDSRLMTSFHRRLD